MEIPYEFIQRLLLALGAGALVGAEREFSTKYQTAGVRSFALASFLGAITVLLSRSLLIALPFELPFLPYLGFLVVTGYSFMIYYILAQKEQRYGITTTFALPLVYLFGILIGYGLYFEAISGAILTTALLYLGRYSHVFVQRLSEEEVSDALQFAILLFVIYPLLPAQSINLFGIDIFLRRLVELVILIALISLAGFLAMRFFGSRAMPVAGFFGGFVSSLSVIITLTNHSKKAGIDSNMFLASVSAANIASLIGDILVLTYSAPALLSLLLPAYMAMLAVYLISSIPFLKKSNGEDEVKLGQPFSVIEGAKFALIFFAVLLVTEYVSHLNSGALIVPSFLAGLVSITSVVASMAISTTSGVLPLQPAAFAIFVAILAGHVAKIAILWTSQENLKKKSISVMVTALLVGGAALFLTVLNY